MAQFLLFERQISKIGMMQLQLNRLLLVSDPAKEVESDYSPSVKNLIYAERSEVTLRVIPDLDPG